MASSLTTVNDLVSNFFTWWFAELTAIWRPFRAALRRTPKKLVLDTSDQQWSLRLQRGVRSQELGRLDSHSAANVARKSIGTLIRKAKLRNSELTLLVPESKSLRRPLDMPEIPEASLRQALSFEIERQTPFRPEDAYFDYRVLARKPDTKRLSIELIAAPRAVIDAMLSKVAEWGLRPSSVDVVVKNTQAGIGINLLNSERAVQRWSSVRVALVLLIIGLLSGILYYPVHVLSAEDESLAAQVAAESAKAKQTLGKRAELDESLRAANFLDSRKQNNPSVMLFLNELTKALPDNTWLARVSQNKDGVKISGYSAAASQLISRIDGIPLFKNPTFSSPIVQDPQNKLERFELSFEIEGHR